MDSPPRRGEHGGGEIWRGKKGSYPHFTLKTKNGKSICTSTIGSRFNCASGGGRKREIYFSYSKWQVECAAPSILQHCSCSARKGSECECQG